MPAEKRFDRAASENPIGYEMDGKGELLSMGNIRFKSPLKVTIEHAYVNNDKRYIGEWVDYGNCAQYIRSVKNKGLVECYF